MHTSVVHIGHGNYVPIDKMLAILSRDTRSVKPFISKAELNKRLINASMGRKVRTVIFTTDDYVILSSIAPQTIARRVPLDSGVEVLDIGGENFIPNHQINAILQINSEPIKNMLKLARAENKVINTQKGNVAKGLVSTSYGYFFFSALTTETLKKRLEGKDEDEY